MDHLDPDTLAAYVDGRLAIADLGQADRHIDACASCRVELSALAATHSQPAGPEVASPEGAVGRYKILRELGRGSMGIVLRAYDPELQRPVALKLLRDVDRELLRREARALAKLRHPNVVSVYDAISEGDAMYVAMELVEGTTLRAFKGRPIRELLAACIAAGRGLAAAHDAGVIHRDFKPENVLCTPAGEVRVSDFGLARTGEEADGLFAGTPAYMPPEALRREPATAASDQYSFCVTVYELLEDARPGERPSPTAMPAWVWKVLRRGLSRDPAGRYPSMHAVVAALADDPAVRRKRRAVLVVAALAAVGTGALITQLVPSGGAACDVSLESWTPIDATRVSAAVARASDGDNARRVVAALDDFAARWRVARQHACTVPAMSACVERSRRQLSQLSNILLGADRKIAARALEAIDRLRDPASCTAADDVTGDSLPRIVLDEQARSVLDRAATLQYVGHLDEAQALASAVSVTTAGRPAIEAEAKLIRGRVEIERAHGEAAEAVLFEALTEAERAHDDVEVAAIWVEIVMATGTIGHKFDVALSNMRAADAAMGRIDAGSELQIRYEYAVGTMLLAHGKLDDARARLEAGIHDAGTEPRRRVQVGLLEMALCDLERQAGKLAAAHAQCDKGLADLEATLGPDHTRIATTLSIVGTLAFGENDMAAAEKAYKRTIAIFDKHGIRDHLAYALAQSNLGAVYASRTDVVHAKQQFERALALFDEFRPDHPQRMFALQGLAGIAARTGDHARAVELYTQVRDAMARSYTPDSQQVLSAEYNLALAYGESDRDVEAQAILDSVRARALTPGKEQWTVAARALDLSASIADHRKDYASAIKIRKQILGVLDHGSPASERALVLRNLGTTYLKMPPSPKRYVEMRDVFEEALALLAKSPDDPYELGRVRFGLALALIGIDKTSKRAIELATQAQQDLARAGSGESLPFLRGSVARFLKDSRTP